MAQDPAQNSMDNIPWQRAEARLFAEDPAYLPAWRIDFPEEGEDLARLDGDGLRLLLAVTVCREGRSPAATLAALKASFLAPWLAQAVAWTEVPIVVTAVHGGGRILPVLLGKTAGNTIVIEEGWLAPDAEKAARAALALGARGSCGFVLVPRTSPGDPSACIDGPSLGLPLAVAARRLRETKAFPKSVVVMTGAVDEQGLVLPVSHVREKAQIAFANEHPARLFFVPVRCQYDLASQNGNSGGIIPVEDYLQADTLLDLCDTDKTGMSVADLAMHLVIWKKYPMEFIAWLADMQAPFEVFSPLLRLGREQGWFADFSADNTERISKRYREVCEAIRAQVSPYSSRAVVTQELFHDLFSGNKALENLAVPFVLTPLLGIFPFTLPLLAGAGLAAMFGEGSGRGFFADLVHQVVGKFHSLYEDQVARTCDQVAAYHMAYRFRVDDMATTLLEGTENFKELDQNPGAGMAYAFLARHMAFCGAYARAQDYAHHSLQYLNKPREKAQVMLEIAYMALDLGRAEEARHCIRLAFILDRDALDVAGTVRSKGNTALASLWKRLRHMLNIVDEQPDITDLALAVELAEEDDTSMLPGPILQVLGLGKEGKARTLFRELCQALGVDHDSLVPECSLERSENPFLHAAYARLLWLQGDQDREQYIVRTLPGADKTHPWQLWACNCGRLLAEGNPQLALRCLDFSLSTCLENTDRLMLLPMALLPLSVMYACDLVSPEGILQKTEDVMERIRQNCSKDEKLDKSHFQPLLQISPADVLKEVDRNTSRYFPYMYR